MPLSPTPHSGKVNGRSGPNLSSSSSTMLPSSGHHSKRPPSPVSRDDDKRRNPDDKWKNDTTDKLLRDRVLSGRGQAFDESTYETISNKHSLSSRLSKSSRAPSLDYVRLKNPPEPPEPSKKKSKDKIEDKVNKSHISIYQFDFYFLIVLINFVWFVFGD